ncbi:MAG: asparagine synthase (glutamine-hydrolyzing) [Candidatus Gracilibacteria bacterium]
MCVIFGYFSFDSKKVNRHTFDKSLRTMIHRGPDFQKSLFLKNDTVAMGHVRLSIIDLTDAANQPMEVDDKYYVIFNGEIYNYIELKQELAAKGYCFSTHSDTEVLVKAYDCWGEECVSKFNGMWAFAIYNTIENTMFCSRDRFGVKPFNYYVDEKRFIFGSEIKPIIAYDSKLRTPNYNSIGLFCREGICGETPETWFDKIYRLLPGHNLTVKDNKITIYKYYHYKTKTQKIAFEDAKRQFSDLFVDAVKLRMRSDVPVGVTLSGGLDSTSIVAGIRQFNNDSINTYTAHFPGFINDEYTTAEKTNQYFALDGNQVTIDYGSDSIDTLSRLIYHLESGHSSPAIFPLWKVYEVAKKKVTVVLEGQGADELLAGYIHGFASAYLIDKLIKFQLGTFVSNLKKLAKNYSIITIAIFYLRLFLPSFMKTWVRRYVLKTEDILIGKLKNFQYRYSPPCHSKSCLVKNLQLSHQTTLVNLLHYGDAISMAFSIESRLPFMDYRLVDFVMTLPEDYLIAEGKGKYIQREALGQILPEYIKTDARKLGFPSPMKEFLEQNKLMLEEILLNKKTFDRGIFDDKKLKKLIHSGLNVAKSRFLFRVLCVELWFRLFIDDKQ